VKDSLSSPWTPLIKVMPALLWGVFLAMAVSGVVTHHPERGLRIFVLLLITPIMGVWLWRNWAVLDRVEITGRDLYLRRRGVEQRVALVDVMNVTVGPINLPTFVRVRLRKEGPFGDEVRFAARAASVSRWSLRLVATESLIAAVDAAKLGRP